MLHSRLAKVADSPESVVEHWKEAGPLDPQREAYRLALLNFCWDKRQDKGGGSCA